ncbi:MAG TPA: TM2 domain-containing protein [Mycobacterium sp.]|nr:TM2 domain-containing protein [Mycobacterium sp.]
MTEPHFSGSENPQQPQNPYQAPGGQYPPPYQGQQPGQQPPYQQPGAYQGGAYPAAYYGVDAYGRPLSDKSKLTAGLLQIFLGGFGVGRFYLGYTNIGVLQLVVTIVTCGIGSIWGLIDGILILIGNVPDPEGRTLRD